MNKNIKIGKKVVGEGEPAFIIAEAGSNHNQKLSQAKELIDAAYACKVDAVKFQMFRAESFYPKNSSMFKLMKKNEFPRHWLRQLNNYANSKGIILLFSLFDKEAIDLLVSINTPAFKWASSETINLPLLRYAAAKNKPMLISTGMCNIADIYEAMEVVHSTGNQDIILLHCTSLYPTMPEQVNLKTINYLQNVFRVLVGYSDHTLSLTIPVAAVARGACVIEKHFTLSRKLKGPDHSYSLEPQELKKMVIAIREVERSLGSEDKRMLPAEKKLARRASLIAKKNILKGTKLTRDMITIERPALGIEPRFLKAIIGLKAKRSIKKNEPISWETI